MCCPLAARFAASRGVRRIPLRQRTLALVSQQHTVAGSRHVLHPVQLAACHLTAIMQVDPLPDNIPALEAPAALVAAARQGITPCQQLSQVRIGRRQDRSRSRCRCRCRCRCRSPQGGGLAMDGQSCCVEPLLNPPSAACCVLPQAGCFPYLAHPLASDGIYPPLPRLLAALQAAPTASI